MCPRMSSKTPSLYGDGKYDIAIDSMTGYILYI